MEKKTEPRRGWHTSVVHKYAGLSPKINIFGGILGEKVSRWTYLQSMICFSMCRLCVCECVYM